MLKVPECFAVNFNSWNLGLSGSSGSGLCVSFKPFVAFFFGFWRLTALQTLRAFLHRQFCSCNEWQCHTRKKKHEKRLTVSRKEPANLEAFPCRGTRFFFWNHRLFQLLCLNRVKGTSFVILFVVITGVVWELTIYTCSFHCCNPWQAAFNSISVFHGLHSSLETGRDTWAMLWILEWSRLSSSISCVLCYIDDLVRESFQISSHFRNLSERWTYNQHYDIQKVFSFHIQITTFHLFNQGNKPCKIAGVLFTKPPNGGGFFHRCSQVKDSPISLVLNDSSRAPPGDEETTKACRRE